MATNAFGDALIDYFTQPYSEFLSAGAVTSAVALAAAAPVPTDTSGNPVLPFNTLGAPASDLPTAIGSGVPAAETDAFGNPFESEYSMDEKDAPADSAAFLEDSEAALANADAQAETINATDYTNTTDSTFVTIPDLENQYAIIANDETGNLEIALVAQGSRFISEGGYVCPLPFLSTIVLDPLVFFGQLTVLQNLLYYPSNR